MTSAGTALLLLLLGQEARLAVEGRIVACRSATDCRSVPASALATELELAEYVWVWSADLAPRRLVRGDVPRLLPFGERRTVAATAPIDVVFGPIQLWQEVPENLLPRVTVAQSSATIPAQHRELIRARAVGSARGSWWAESSAPKMSLTTAPAPPIRIKVTNEDGRPLPAASIAVSPSRKGRRHAPVVATYRTGTAGDFAIDPLPDNEPLVMVINAGGYAPAIVESLPSAVPESIVMSRGSTLTGRVIDATGKAIEEAAVIVDAWLGGAASFRREAFTDGRGQFRIEAVPQGKVLLTFGRREFASLQQEVRAEESVIDVGDIRLDRGRDVRVRVIDDRNAPVADAVIDAGAGRTNKSDRDGVAVMSQLRDGEQIQLRAHARHYLPAEKRIEVNAGAEVVVTLPRAFVVTGRFVDEHGLGVSRGDVKVRHGAIERTYLLGEGGAFEINLAAGDAASVQLIAKDAISSPSSIAPGMAGETRDLGDLRVAESIRLRGRVIDAFGLPVPLARVWTPRPSAAGALLPWVRGEVAEARTDEQGLFEIRGLSSIPQTLRIDAPGFARQQVAVAESGDVGEVIVTPGVRVNVLTDAAGEALMARLAPGDELLEYDAASHPVRDGRAVFPNVAPGTARLSVLRGRSTICDQSITIAAEEDVVEVRCDSNELTLSGMAMIGDRPAPGGYLEWSSGRAASADAVIVNRRSPGGLLHQDVYGGGTAAVTVVVDEQGRFETADVTPGEWKVTWINPAGGRSAAQSLAVPQVARHAVTIRFPDGRVSGRVTHRGQAVVGAQILDADGALLALSAEEGRFNLNNLTPGRAFIRALWRDLQSEPLAIDVHASSAEPVTIELAAANRRSVRLHVTGDGGVVADGAFVFVERSGGVGTLLTTDAAGGVELAIDKPDLPVRLAVVWRGQWHFGSWQVLDDEEHAISMATNRGELLVRTEGDAGTVSVLTADGWNLTSLLRRIGSAPIIQPHMPIVLRGLPSGTYSVQVNGKAALTATVQAGRQSEVAFADSHSP